MLMMSRDASTKIVNSWPTLLPYIFEKNEMHDYDAYDALRKHFQTQAKLIIYWIHNTNVLNFRKSSLLLPYIFEK